MKYSKNFLIMQLITCWMKILCLKMLTVTWEQFLLTHFTRYLYCFHHFNVHIFKMTSFSNNDSSLNNISEIDALSLYYLSELKLPFLIWLPDTLLNISLAIFLLYVLQLWKVYEGDVWFLMRCHLWSEIVLVVFSFFYAIWHLIFAYKGWPEVMSPKMCHHIVGIQAPMLFMSGWFTVWVSCDRYVAVTRPMSYESRWLFFVVMLKLTNNSRTKIFKLLGTRE